MTSTNNIYPFDTTDKTTYSYFNTGRVAGVSIGYQHGTITDDFWHSYADSAGRVLQL